MNAEHTLLEKSIKRTTITSNVVSVAVSIGTALFIVYGFYFRTNTTLESHTSQIEQVQEDVRVIDDKINQSELSAGISKTELKALQDKVNGIDTKVDKMDDKLDRILLKK